MWYVYLLKCKKDYLYIGITKDIQARLKKHNDGTGAKFTRAYRPCRLINWCSAPTKSEALKLEYRLKQLAKTEKEKAFKALFKSWQ